MNGSGPGEAAKMKNKPNHREGTPIVAMEYFSLSRQYIEIFENSIYDEKFHHRIKAYYYNLDHGIELLLKSFLLLNGVHERVTKNDYGHELKKLYTSCLAFGLTADDEFSKLIDWFMLYADEMDLKYPTEYKLGLPEREKCVEIMGRVVRDISQILSPRYFDALFQIGVIRAQ
jgi:hypothetical protein